jgi:hypothetical protein
MQTFLINVLIPLGVGLLVAVIIDWKTKKRVWAGVIGLVLAVLGWLLLEHYKPVEPTAPIVTSPAVVDPSAPIEISGPYATKTFRISVGNYQDFRWESRKMRVALLDIVHHARIPDPQHVLSEADQAKVQVDNDGALVDGGEETTHVGINEFLVPQKESADESTKCVYYFYTHESGMRFFRLVVDHINPAAKEVTFNVVFARTNPP